MAWVLDVHMLDVGQGESTFLVARNPATNATRSMLIDGGDTGYAQIVHNYMVATGIALDHILLTHYDKDHSRGVLALLRADNFHAVCAAIAATVAAQPTSTDRAANVAGFACAATAAVFGAYGPSQAEAGKAVATARKQAKGQRLNDGDAASWGITAAENDRPDRRRVQPAFQYPVRTRNDMAERVAIAAADAANAGGAVATAARDAAHNVLLLGVPDGSRFATGGRYARTHIIDVGAAPKIPQGYSDVIGGQYTHHANVAVQAPRAPDNDPGAAGVNRPRTTPALGSEVLFHSGRAAGPPPASAPAAVVVAINQTTWPNGTRFPPSGQADNDVSIGLVVQFNNFAYWTAGDLPWQGEDPVAAAVIKGPLPNPAGGDYPQLRRFACFKCGHHGARTSTSQKMLDTTKPRVALISAGKNDSYEHPAMDLITRLHNSPSISYFYLSNCKFQTALVPASMAGHQLAPNIPPNKSRLAGDNREPNSGLGRNRGDITVSINEAASLLPDNDANRQYSVRYWDYDANYPAAALGAQRIENVTF
jgi:beta-lactamase superfamily II metal-dependent hydrolase